MDTDGYRNATKETALVASYNNQEPLLARIWPKKLKKKMKKFVYFFALCF